MRRKIHGHVSALPEETGDGRLVEALLLADPEDQDSLDNLLELVEDLLLRLDGDQAAVEQPVRDCIARLENGGRDGVGAALERLTSALAPVLGPTGGAAPADAAVPAGGAPPAPEATPPRLAGTSPSSPSLADDPELVREFVVSAREHLDDADACLLTLEQDTADPEAVAAVFRAFHTIKGMAGFLTFRSIEAAAHDAEDTLDAVRKGALDLDPEAMDTLFGAVDHLRELVGQVVEPGASGESAASPERDAGPDAPAGDATSPTTSVRSTVHVDEERLDRLLETIGELVIAEASLSQSLQTRGGGEAALVQLGRLDKISRQLQEMATSIRMVTMRTTLRRMARLVRDLSRESGRPVDCVLEGEEIELDKHVVEGITDSLVHLVRNAVDHGVEADPDERELAGKPRSATVRISATHTGGRIVIEVEDDGRGIDTASVLRRARELGMVGADETPPDDDLTRLLFTPGFSTRGTVTGVSGRGVGMDVVKRTAEDLLGSVAVSSIRGRGTTVRLTLPLTLAIIDGMLVRVGDQRCFIPALAIERSQRIEAGDLTDVLGQAEVLATPQGLVPLIRLRELFGMDEDGGHDDDLVTIVSAADGSALAGLVVSELLGQHQIVMKSLGAGLGEVTGVSGAAILADGTVGLVIDVQQTVRLAHGGKG